MGISMRRRATIPPRLLLSVAVINCVIAFGYLTVAAHASAQVSTWQTFHDPVYGVSFRYPASWLLTREGDGSHVSLVNQRTFATISPVVTLTTESSAHSLSVASATPVGATDVMATRLGTLPAFAYRLPYSPDPRGDSRGSFNVPVYDRYVTATLRYRPGSIMTYTFVLTQRVDVAAYLSAPTNTADDITFEHVVASFTAPSANSPAALTRSGQVTSSCDAVCWADANYSYNKYDLSGNGRDCALAYKQCVYESQAQTQGRYQPDYQCAEYVARALTQAGQIPGLNNGGAGGTSPVTANSGSYTYGTYPFTYTSSYSADRLYALVNVGTSATTGLYQYLMDSGLGVSLGTNVSAAAPGDVLFFYSGAPSDATRAHVMLITATVNDGWSGAGGWDAYLDGHNRDRYHLLLSQAGVSSTWQFEIIHLRQRYGIQGAPSLSGSWTQFTDGYQQTAYWTTTAGANSTAVGQFSATTNAVTCAVGVYVPYGSATTTATYGIQLADNAWAYRNVNQNNYDGWALLYKWGELPSAPVLVTVNNGNGTTGQQLGVGAMALLC